MYVNIIFSIFYLLFIHFKAILLIHVKWIKNGKNLAKKLSFNFKIIIFFNFNNE